MIQTCGNSAQETTQQALPRSRLLQNQQSELNCPSPLSAIPRPQASRTPECHPPNLLNPPRRADQGFTVATGAWQKPTHPCSCAGVSGSRQKACSKHRINPHSMQVLRTLRCLQLATRARLTKPPSHRSLIGSNPHMGPAQFQHAGQHVSRTALQVPCTLSKQSRS